MARSKRNKRERKHHHRWLQENGWCRTWASGVYRTTEGPPHAPGINYPLLSRRLGCDNGRVAGVTAYAEPTSSLGLRRADALGAAMTDHWQHTPKVPCPKKHTWVYYHSYRFRECLDCEKRESLWADFGLAKLPEKPDDQ